MARDLKKMLRADVRTFNLLATGPMTSRQMAAALERSDSTAVHSLARLVIYGLATAAPREPRPAVWGSVAWVWTIVPGAVFPEPPPRKNAKGGPKVAPKVARDADADDMPPIRIRRAGTLPAEIAESVGLAGLVQQMRGKT